MDAIKLDIGCGIREREGWYHIDRIKAPHIKWHDVTQLPFDDSTVNCIYSSHLIAYFDREEILQVFAEWFRVLKPGGSVFISTPDWDILRQINQPLIGPLYGKMDNPPIYHKTVYNYHDLYTVLRKIGFKRISRFDPHEHDCSMAEYDGKKISLNIQAWK